MKKSIKCLTAIVASMCLLFGVAACSDYDIPESEKPHEHNYSETVVPPTCTEKGYTLHVCTEEGCGDSYKDNEVDALGHAFEKHFCTRCSVFNEDAPFIEGLEYTPVYEDPAKEDPQTIKAYTVTGVGSANIDNYIKIESRHSDKTVTGIGDGALADLTGVKVIRLPETVEEIGDNAFKGCSALKSVTLSTSIERIGLGAFEGCSSMESMTLPMAAGKHATRTTDDGKVEEYIEYLHFGYIFGAETSEQNAEFIPASLKTVEIVGTRDITDGSFAGSGVETVTMTGRVRKIGDNAFANCAKLGAVTFASATSRIGDGAFENCVGLDAVKFGNALSAIGNNAFKGCAKLGAVSFGKETTQIGDGAFENCVKLSEIVIPVPTDKNAESACIGLGAFKGCSAMASMSLPMTAGRIASVSFGKPKIEYKHFGYIFGADTYAKNAEFVPEALKTVTVTGKHAIVDNAFSGLTAIENVKIAGAANIGAGAFDGCTAIETVNIAKSAKIGANAFDGCEKLRDLTFGKSVKSIGEAAFNGCEALATVHYKGTIAEFGATKFADKYSSPLAYSAELRIGGHKINYK